MQFSSIQPIDRARSGATIPDQSGLVSNGIEGEILIPQSPSITETSPADYFVFYPGHTLGESYPSDELQSVYSTATTDWAKIYRKVDKLKHRQRSQIIILSLFHVIFLQILKKYLMK